MGKLIFSKKSSLLLVLFFVFFVPLKSMRKQKDAFSPLIYDAKLEIFKYLSPKDLTALSKINDNFKYIVLDEIEERLNSLEKANEVLKQMAQIKKEYVDKNELNELSNDLMYSLAIKDFKHYMYLYIQDELKGKKPSINPDNNQNLLHSLVIFDDSDLVECFINTIKIQINPKNVRKELAKYMNNQDINGNTPLHLAVNCNENSAKIIELLIKNGANCEAENIKGNTALHLAAKKAKILVVQTLLSFGAETAAINSDQQTPDEYATASCSNCNKTYPKPCEKHQAVIALILKNLYSQKINFKYTCTIF